MKERMEINEIDREIRQKLLQNRNKILKDNMNRRNREKFVLNK